MSSTLALVPDDLDDETHNDMDRLVVNTGLSSPSNLALASHLLAVIVATSGTTLNPRYRDILHGVDLLNHHPELMEMMTVAWAAKSFKTIRRLGSSPPSYL